MRWSCPTMRKGTLSRVAELIAACRAAGVPVLIDPKGTDFKRYRGAFALTPNRGEFEAVVGSCADEAELLRKGEALRAELELTLLLVTRGEQGMTLFERGAEPLTLPTQAREVFDVTGAGDTVIALLAAGVAAGLERRRRRGARESRRRHRRRQDRRRDRQRAPSCSARCIRKAAAAAVSSSCRSSSALVAEAKARGERVVLTNGCFDILHAGHVGLSRGSEVVRRPPHRRGERRRFRPAVEGADRGP